MSLHQAREEIYTAFNTIYVTLCDFRRLDIVSASDTALLVDGAVIISVSFFHDGLFVTFSSAFAPQEHCFKLSLVAIVPSISISGGSHENTGCSDQIPCGAVYEAQPRAAYVRFSRGVVKILSAFNIPPETFKT